MKEGMKHRDKGRCEMGKEQERIRGNKPRDVDGAKFCRALVKRRSFTFSLMEYLSINNWGLFVFHVE